MSAVRRLWRPGLIVLALAALAPYLLDSLQLESLMDVLVMAVAIASLVLLTGVTGQISVGQGAFQGAGAYATVIVAERYDLSAWVTLPVAVVVAGALGAVIGLPALRIRGMNLALVTLALALVFPTAILKWDGWTGGIDGYPLTHGLVPPGWFWAPDVVWVYWVLLAITAVVLVGLHRLIHSSAGRTMMATRDHELMASAIGVRTPRIKVFAFAVSAGLSGLSGWMFAVHHEFLSPADFGAFVSIYLLLGMVVGGSASVWGAVLGAAFVVYVPDAATDVGIPALLVPGAEGLILIIVLRFLPGGIASLGSDLAGRVRSRSPRSGSGPDTTDATDATDTAVGRASAGLTTST